MDLRQQQELLSRGGQNFINFKYQAAPDGGVGDIVRHNLAHAEGKVRKMSSKRTVTIFKLQWFGDIRMQEIYAERNALVRRVCARYGLEDRDSYAGVIRSFGKRKDDQPTPKLLEASTHPDPVFPERGWRDRYPIALPNVSVCLVSPLRGK